MSKESESRTGSQLSSFRIDMVGGREKVNCQNSIFFRLLTFDFFRANRDDLKDGWVFLPKPPPHWREKNKKWKAIGGHISASRTLFELILSLNHVNLRHPSMKKKIISIGAVVEKKMEHTQAKDPNGDDIAGTASIPY